MKQRTQRRTQRPSHRVRIEIAFGVALAGLMISALFGAVVRAQGLTYLRYRAGYTVEGSWLCYGWSSGAYHCTQHWREQGNEFISLNPSWVPSELAATRSASASASASAPPSSGGSGLPLRGAIGQWNRTGYGAYAAWWGGDGYSLGNCTAGARFLSGNRIPTNLGDAKDWAYNAARDGMATGSTPRVGATVVFAPGVQGASYLGHVGHVVGVYANGWFMMEAENDYFDGGGFNRVDYRYAHSGYGVSFIY